MHQADRPNIVLITSDQQRYDSIRSHGSAFMNTPNMDRLGQEGVSFRRAYCPCTVCTPSRVSMMTGQQLSRHGSYNIGTFTSDYNPFLSTYLRENGYRTHHIGKAHWHPFWVDSPENRKVPEDGQPLRDFAGFETAEPAIGHSTFGVTGFYEHWVRQKGFDPATLKVDRLFAEDANDTGNWNLPAELHNGHWIAERAIDFLERQDGSRPFFLNLGFQDPHHPHVLPSDFHNRVDPASIPLPEFDLERETNPAEHIPLLLDGKLVESRFNGNFVIAGNVKAPWRPYFQDEAKTRATRAYYYSMVQLLDDQLGRIMVAVDELGLRDNTLFIFTTDHGEMLGDHSIGQKGPMIYEGVSHIPFLMRYPNGFAPCEVEDCVSLIDILPTVLDFARIEDRTKRDGLSLKDRLQGNVPALDRKGVRIEFKEEPDRIRFKCWVTPEWKLAVYLGEPFGELYDLVHDPGEMHNLFDVPEYQAVKARLLIELLNDLERSEPVHMRPCRA
ncbi:Arylsulfatase [Paenibacillus solanacearum]|uniref:Arylsulfatase n=1 Tax=Paenibacillus solanacearum TaxID=2048548 RepID=A0A916NRJ8_9BACL|nr:sulfatase-like hydrolase/transferase [Paenibacillus solanacearum]CAG7648022.1 Arylsulfatase [Paenibacillus solanacearum]